MSGSNTAENEFLGLLNGAIEKNISNNQFGVEELADAMNMSRSNLLRKVKKLTGLSVNQLISQARLTKSMELLKTTSMNVSEVSHQVGFGSTSYFIKVFRERYGYPPGEAGKRTAGQENVELEPKKAKRAKPVVLIAVIVLLVVIVAAVVFFFPGSPKILSKEKSIAVLPFKNESSDSTNIYLINGLMESTLNKLQEMKELKVISRTTSEKYRNTKKSIPEMAKELNVNYFIEGSGQKIGDKLLLNIQLIEASTDRHLWAKQYRRETSDIFELQTEIAKNIADEIQVVITPAEENRITRKPTNNIVAYDYFLKGKELFYRSGRGDLEASLPYFAKAIEYDSTFALAYGTVAMVYYYLDIFMIEKRFEKELEGSANKAMQFDPTLTESFIAIGLSHAAKKEYTLAVAALEKGHELDPHSGLVIHFLTEFYSIHVFNAAKYLEYALIGVKIDRESPVDSATTSFKYFHLANAFVGAGFIDEALMYADKSLEYNPNNYFAKYFKPFVVFAKDRDIKRVRESLENALRKDSTRIDIIQEVAKFYFVDRDYKTAHKYYKAFIDMRKAYHLQVYEGEALRMAATWRALGYRKEAKQFEVDFKKHAESDKSIYGHLNMAAYYAYVDNKNDAIKEFRAFLDEDSNYLYWTLLLDGEPYMNSVREMPEYKALLKRLEDDFWENNRQIRKLMESKGLL